VRERIAESWALWSILAAQATLTLPWMWRTAAFSDEAVYLSASHETWSHLMSTASSFPGVPVLYLPLVGVFDSVGGLIAARLVSMIFMLGATALIYVIGDRSDLKPGAAFTIISATKQPDGTLETARVNVGRNGAVPQ